MDSPVIVLLNAQFNAILKHCDDMDMRDLRRRDPACSDESTLKVALAGRGSERTFCHCNNIPSRDRKGAVMVGFFSQLLTVAARKQAVIRT